MIKKYKKKPVEIEAVQFTGDPENLKELYEFVGKNATVNYIPDVIPIKRGENTLDIMGPGELTLTIKTLEGDMTASLGDYIIKGIKGEFYPCKPDIFIDTYISSDEEANYDIITIHPEKGDVLCVTVDTENFTQDKLQFLVDKIRRSFPNNDLICIPKNSMEIKIDETVQS